MLSNVKDKCWICNDYIFSLIFWTRERGIETEGIIEPVLEEGIIRKVEQLNTIKKYKFGEPGSSP